MTKKTLNSAYTFHEPYVCSRCGARVKKREIIAGRAKEVDETTCVCAECLSRTMPQESITGIGQATRAGDSPALAKEDQRRRSPVAENEEFVVMIAAAMEDSMVRDKILFIAQLTSFHRESLINSLITELKLNGKALSLVSAIECLKDDKVAKRTIEVLTSR